jgi:hypothetical protein
MDIIAEPLRAEDFAPFGDVLEAPKESGRSYFNGTLGNGRTAVTPSLSIARVQPLATLPLSAPKPANGGPDASKARRLRHGRGPEGSPFVPTPGTFR